MKAKSILALMLMVFAFLVQSQDAPPKHRGMHPRLKADGKVVDESGKQLGILLKMEKSAMSQVKLLV